MLRTQLLSDSHLHLFHDTLWPPQNSHTSVHLSIHPPIKHPRAPGPDLFPCAHPGLTEPGETGPCFLGVWMNSPLPKHFRGGRGPSPPFPHLATWSQLCDVSDARGPGEGCSGAEEGTSPDVMTTASMSCCSCPHK